jgi:iron complex transport system ATP-binding protein
MTATYAALEPWWHRYTDEDRAAAQRALDRLGVGDYATRTVGSLSSGEQQRVLLARAFMTDPGLVLLDEPTAQLDLGGREAVVAALADLAQDRSAPPMVMVTHHVDDPPGSTRSSCGGRVLAAGPLDEALRADVLSAAFGVDLEVERRPNGRFSAWAR